jgi:hypothetical protein
MRWFEFDTGWMLIRSLAAVGLASDIYVKNKRWKAIDADGADDAEPVDPTATP